MSHVEPDIAELLREIRDSEQDTQNFERQILSAIEQLKVEQPPHTPGSHAGD